MSGGICAVRSEFRTTRQPSPNTKRTRIVGLPVIRVEGDMPHAVAQRQSFSLTNVVPQKPALNRAVWEGIESAVRRLAEHRGQIYMVTGPAFQGQNLQALKGRALVPTATWKAVYDPIARGAAAHICTNVSRPRCNTLSLAALAQVTGVDANRRLLLTQSGGYGDLQPPTV